MHRPSPGRPGGTPCRTARRTGSQAIPSLWHATSPGVSEPFPEVRGSRQSPGSHALSDVDLELRPLPSTGVNRLQRYYEPVRHPARPGLSLAGVRLGSHALPPVGLPVLPGCSVCSHAVVNTPVEPLVHVASRGVSLIFPSGCGLPRFLGGSASTFGLSRPARRSLALRPANSPSRFNDPFSRRLRRFRYLHRRSDSFRLERLS